MTKVALLLGFCTFGPWVLHGQTEAWPALYDPFRVRTIYLQMESGSWGSVVSDSDFDDPQDAQLWTDGETPIPVTVKRKSDPAIGQKVSVKIDLNARRPGQEWHGVEKLSLENGAEGGLVKEGFAWNMHRLAAEAGFYNYPAAYAAWVRLVVDGQLIGLYASVEERDDQMLKNKGLWKEGATWLYKVDPNATIEEGEGDSPTLAHLCYSPFVARNGCAPPDLEADLQAWIDMQGMLTLGAIEAFTGNGDGLFTHDGKNHFTADFAPPTELKRLYFPWDLDTGISSVSAPILGAAGAYQSQILGHPWFRQWYLHIMSDLLHGPLSTAALTDFIDRVEPVLTPALLEDPNSSLEESAAGHFQSLRQWITNRIANVRTQIGPVIGPARLQPAPGEIISGFELALSHTNVAGTIYYTIDGTDPRAPGGGISGIAYTAAITLTNSAHVMARVCVGTNWSALRQGTFNIANQAAGLKLTEIMYQPRAPSTNGNGGEYEFIEMQNRSGRGIDLSGCYFEGIGFRFPAGALVAPGNFVVLVRNAIAFTNRYPGAAYHGIYRGGLDKGGEKLRLKNSDGNNVFSVEYDDDPPWPLAPNGFGWSLVNVNPERDPDDPENWRASANINGSPGTGDLAPPYGVGLVINEVLAHTDPPQEDAIELHNPTATPIEISGWFLSDQIDNSDPTGAILKKFRIPDGTSIPAGGFKVFYETNFSAPGAGTNAFALSSLGDQVYLASANSNGVLTGCIVGADFGASDNGVSLGRHRTGQRVDFMALDKMTLGGTNPPTLIEFRQGAGASNSAPRLGPVVINEIMYHPAEGEYEFIEFYNRTATNIDLQGWSVEGAAFVFPAGAIIGSNDFLLLLGTTNITAAQFRNSNNVPASVPILRHAFDLQNAGENLVLEKPNDFPTNAPIAVDRVRYNDKGLWPTEADGHGPSLERVAPTAYGNDPLNWRTTTRGGSPGRSSRIIPRIAVVRSSSWKYNSLSRNLGTAWQATNYSDSGWSSGKGPFGHGQPSLGTVLTHAPGVTNRPLTVYFRKEFVVNDEPASITNLILSANYDDGFIAYLNGLEVARRSITSGPVDAFTLAGNHPAGSYEAIDLTVFRNELRRGKNLFAVELHQQTGNDVDSWWDAELSYQVSTNDAPAAIRIVSFGLEAGGVGLVWDSVAGQSYRVQQSSDLSSWSNASLIITATAATTTYTDSTASMNGRRFYRIVLVP